MNRIHFIFLIFIILFGIILDDGCSHQPGKKPFNVVLISLDTVRFDALGYTGNNLTYTPNIDDLAKKGVTFHQAVSTNSLTTPAHCSLFTGRNPTAHGVHTNGVYALSSSEQTLAEFLKEHGYFTAGFASAFPISRRFGMAQGFDLYNDQMSLLEQEKKAKFRMGAFAQRPAADVATAVISWIKENLPNDRPFFLFIHFFDAHAPYAPPLDFIERFGNSKERRYAGEIAYIDSQLGRILSAFDDANIRNNTIFIVTSDHGESLGEHGEETHGIFIYDSTIRIPLFFTGGPIPQGKSLRDQVGIIDIFPTIADLLGFTIPDRVHGRSLKGLLLGSVSQFDITPYYIESFLSYESFGWSPLIGFRTSSNKLIRAPRPELYDLKHDPFEKDNLYQRKPDLVKDLENEFTKFLKNITETSDNARTQLSGEERAILHSLGYTGAGVITPELDERADPKDRIDLFKRMEAARVNIHSGKDVESSLEELKRLAKEDRSNLTLRLTIGQTLATMSRFREAEEYYRSLILEYSNFHLAYNELAHLLWKRKAWQEAARYYRKSLDMNPIQIELYPNYIYALTQMNLLHDAISNIDKALELIPENAILKGIRGSLAYNAQDYATAEKYFSAVYATDPSDINVAQDYARTLLRNGKASQAITILKPFESIIGENVDFQLLYGQCLAQVGHIKQGIKWFERVLAHGNKSSAHYFLGLCYLKMGKIDEAEKHFNQLPTDDPNYENSQRALKMYKSQ